MVQAWGGTGRETCPTGVLNYIEIGTTHKPTCVYKRKRGGGVANILPYFNLISGFLLKMFSIDFDILIFQVEK